MSKPTFDPSLRNEYKEDSERIRRDFEGNGSGRSCTQERAQLVDKLLLNLWDRSPGLRGNASIALVALGGFGRRDLYPHSDIDLLFLCENESLRARAKDAGARRCARSCGTRGCG